MAAFREGKLARKKNGQLQSTVVKSTTENLLDPRKKQSSDSLADAKVSFQCDIRERCCRGVELGLFSVFS